MKRIVLQPAYLLHRRPFRETSFLIELFTFEYGRLTAVAKGVRKAHSNSSGLLQPFIPLLVSFSGKSDLMTLTHVEVKSPVKYLQGDSMYAGFYLNELLLCLLHKWDPYPTLFQMYEKTVNALEGDILEQKLLRSFETFLLEKLGYGLLPKNEKSLQNSFSKDKYYRFVPEQGFLLTEETQTTEVQSALFSGSCLLAIARENWQNEEILQASKRLNRLMLTFLLGNRPLYSRRLFFKLGQKE